MSCQCEISEQPAKKRGKGKAWNVLAGGLVLLIPKCAMCWTAYLNLLGLTGISLFNYRPWFIPVAIVCFCITLGRLLLRAINTRRFLPFTLALVAAALVAWQKLEAGETWISMAAMFLMLAAWIADLQPAKKNQRLQVKKTRLFRRRPLLRDHFFERSHTMASSNP